jgi:hypothetical protein
MRSLLLAALTLLVFVSCRSAGPGQPLAPLKAATPDEAHRQLLVQAETIQVVRSLLRVRATVGGKTQTFTARLSVDRPGRMDMTFFTPIGTTAATIFADGDEVSFVNNVEGTSWEGSAEDLARSLAFYAADLQPAEMAMLLLGFPPRSAMNLEFTATGLRRASGSGVEVVFEPAFFPPKFVIVKRGGDVVEIEHLETVGGK